MVLHGLKRIFQKSTPNISSSDRTEQLRAKTIYAGTAEMSKTIAKGNNNRYKTYNGPYEVLSMHHGCSSLVASASYKDLLDITKGKFLLNQTPLSNATETYYEHNFGNGEMYVGNYHHFDISKTTTTYGPTGCHNSVLVYDISTTGFTGSESYIDGKGTIGISGPSGTFDSNQHIFIDPKHCYYSDSCLSSSSYLKFVGINLSGSTGSTGVTGTSQFYAQQIISSDQYRGFTYPLSNFNITCKPCPVKIAPARAQDVTALEPRAKIQQVYNYVKTSTSTIKYSGTTVLEFSFVIPPELRNKNVQISGSFIFKSSLNILITFTLSYVSANDGYVRHPIYDTFEDSHKIIAGSPNDYTFKFEPSASNNDYDTSDIKLNADGDYLMRISFWNQNTNTPVQLNDVIFYFDINGGTPVPCGSVSLVYY